MHGINGALLVQIYIVSQHLFLLDVWIDKDGESWQHCEESEHSARWTAEHAQQTC